VIFWFETFAFDKWGNFSLYRYEAALSASASPDALARRLLALGGAACVAPQRVYPRTAVERTVNTFVERLFADVHATLDARRRGEANGDAALQDAAAVTDADAAKDEDEDEYSDELESVAAAGARVYTYAVGRCTLNQVDP
jgi:Skp family chaperone for outer membrane proteins